MRSKNATVALMSVTRIIVCKYSMGSSSSLLRSWLRSITPPASRGSPRTWTTRFGKEAAGRGPLDAEAARGGGLDRREHNLGRAQARGGHGFRLARSFLGRRA